MDTTAAGKLHRSRTFLPVRVLTTTVTSFKPNGGRVNFIWVTLSELTQLTSCCRGSKHCWLSHSVSTQVCRQVILSTFIFADQIHVWLSLVKCWRLIRQHLSNILTFYLWDEVFWAWLAWKKTRRAPSPEINSCLENLHYLIILVFSAVLLTLLYCLECLGFASFPSNNRSVLKSCH